MQTGTVFQSKLSSGLPIHSPANHGWHMPHLPLYLFLLTWKAFEGNDIIIPEEAVRSMNPKSWIWATIISLNSGPVSRRVWLIFNQALSDIQSKGEIQFSCHGTSHSHVHMWNILFAKHPRSCFIKQVHSTSQLNIPGTDLQINVSGKLNSLLLTMISIDQKYGKRTSKAEQGRRMNFLAPVCQILYP